MSKPLKWKRWAVITPKWHGNIQDCYSTHWTRKGAQMHAGRFGCIIRVRVTEIPKKRKARKK